MSDHQRIAYRFELPDGTTKSLEFFFEGAEFKLRPAPATAPPFWTELNFSRCANCPLDVSTHPHCPAALQMAPAIDALKALVSFDSVGVTVTQEERTVSTHTTVQQAMSSVLGLVMATAGCPWTDHLRPMARFHLPFASEAETFHRSICMYLLARELLQTDALRGYAALDDLYENLHIVNRDMSRRLGAATQTDPARNAIALLDARVALLPAGLESFLADLAPLFSAWQNKANSAI